MADTAPTLRTLRSPLGRVRGLGAARGGTHHWWMQRVTSIALLPLTLWLVFSLAGMPDSTWQEATSWIGRPFNAVLLLAFLAAAFHHTAAGLQVVIEDYLRPELARMGAILAVKGACALLWLAATLAVLRIAV
ncbi:succinate dehydrogenase, hydrophobic membrane anchor protein [Roseomonas sp. PWR1]|uniref:Succinate dehydrogenase hydrophobic membrane anchor subunit n=1 Tax=Roseomonas nitratireducens TaxID=2820810 RepID=A0ABS4AQL2_9PROT|nr:succinate dehydrogenase, hydrophobic membrane anchor protein [Neoroseomonas nitratireducens]MBP0463529.1 succinate dehydrogenase, hydrophobic membrane anchor protein [Neoroseomonas nitratireducens]